MVGNEEGRGSAWGRDITWGATCTDWWNCAHIGCRIIRVVGTKKKTWIVIGVGFFSRDWIDTWENDTKMEQQEWEHDIDLMPYKQEVNPSTSLDLKVEQVLNDKGDIEILEDNPEVEMHKISFNESQNRVV